MNENVHVLLTGVAYYNSELPNLPFVKNDLQVMKRTLRDDLKIPENNIRICGDEGTLTVNKVLDVLIEESKKITNDDVFLFYFSGHGGVGRLALSDTTMRISELFLMLNKIKVKNIIVLIDSCCSGSFDFKSSDNNKYEKEINDFVDKGNVVLASSRANESSGFDKDDEISFFTSCFVLAIKYVKTVEGKKSLFDITEHTFFLMNRRNEMNKNTSSSQNMVYKTNLTGTIYFDVEKYEPYKTTEFYEDCDEYTIVKVKPCHTHQKRYIFEVILKDANAGTDDVKRITKGIISKHLCLDVYDGPETEKLYQGKPADVIWCHYGFDEADICQSNFKYLTSWQTPNDLSVDKNICVNYISVEKNDNYELCKSLYEENDNKDITNYEVMRRADELVKAALYLKDLYNDFYTEYLNGSLFEDTLLDFVNENKDKVDDIYDKFDKLPMRSSIQEQLALYTQIIYDIYELFNCYSREGLGGDSFDTKTFFINKALGRINESLEKLKNVKLSDLYSRK